jgi:hypothetical protein
VEKRFSTVVPPEESLRLRKHCPLRRAYAPARDCRLSNSPGYNSAPEGYPHRANGARRLALPPLPPDHPNGTLFRRAPVAVVVLAPFATRQWVVSNSGAISALIVPCWASVWGKSLRPCGEPMAKDGLQPQHLARCPTSTPSRTWREAHKDSDRARSGAAAPESLRPRAMGPECNRGWYFRQIMRAISSSLDPIRQPLKRKVGCNLKT